MNPVKHSIAEFAGQRFGRLVALERSSAIGIKRVTWAFSCDCGSVVVKAKRDVITGGTRSCGCLKREVNRTSTKPMDLSGQRFGRLVAVELMPKTGRRRSWKCICDCGAITVVDVGDLRGASTISCGCFRLNYGTSNAIDLAGQIFGRLRALRRVSSDQRGVRWLCKCNCGKEHTALAAELRGGRVISCGCAILDQPGLTNAKVCAQRSARGHVRRARVRNAKGSFTADEILSLHKLQRGRCASCRNKLGPRFHRDHRMPIALGGSNSIDNIELLCAGCNLKKNAKDPIVWANQNGRLL